MRAVTAAVIGASCAAAWVATIHPAGDLACQSPEGVGCAWGRFTVVAPVLWVLWALVAWGLLRLARFTPSWPTAVAGLLVTTGLLVVLGFVAIGMRRSPTLQDALVGLAAAGAAGYALAAVVSAGYRGRRDRTEHRGQDG
ncbi:hypothetical protein LFM09_45140 [Lentzea alba]|uniref:hypothetical protein n=1 Tax=Lentzea alba TaxID=2714351 RepID=UPI0039BF8643